MKRKLSVLIAVIMLFAAISFAGCDWFDKKELKNATYFQTELVRYAEDGSVEYEAKYDNDEALTNGNGILVNVEAKKFGFFEDNKTELAFVVDYTADGSNFAFDYEGRHYEGTVIGKDTVEMRRMYVSSGKLELKTIYQNFNKKAYALSDRTYTLVESYNAEGEEQPLQNYTASFSNNYETLTVYYNDSPVINKNITRGFNSFEYTDGGTSAKGTLESNDRVVVKIYDDGNLVQEMVFRASNGGSEN